MDNDHESQDSDIYSHEQGEVKRNLRNNRVVSMGSKELHVGVSVNGSVKMKECVEASPCESIKREAFDDGNIAAPNIAGNSPEAPCFDCQGMEIKQETEVKSEVHEGIDESSYEFNHKEESDSSSCQPASDQQCKSTTSFALPSLHSACGTLTSYATSIKEETEVKIETPEELEEPSFEFNQKEDCVSSFAWQPANVQQCKSTTNFVLPGLHDSCGASISCATGIKESLSLGLNLSADQSCQMKASTDLTALEETSCGSICMYSDKKFVCNQCSYMTNFKNRFNQHYITHVKEKKYGCDQCSFRTKCRSYLNKHCLSHSIEKKFTCDQCPFKTNIKSHLSQHCLIHGKEKKFACDQCSYQTNFKYSLNLHFLNHHNNSKEKQFVCDQCSYKTNNKGNLKIHCLSHSKEKQFVCDQCSYKTNIKSNLKVHCLSHSKEKQYACDQCSYRTYNKGNSKQHAFTHNKEKQFACDQCSYKTDYRSYLKRHCSTHSKEKQFACDQCLYKTNNVNNFKGHCLAHSKEK